jgi:hypothetical protein
MRSRVILTAILLPIAWLAIPIQSLHPPASPVAQQSSASGSAPSLAKFYVAPDLARLEQWSPSPEDENFLDELQYRSFLYFWETANPENGLIPDRSKADGSALGDVASTASVGFGLTALCIGVERQWVSREAAYERALTTLRFFADKIPNERGFYYHFLDIKTGRRVWDSELSSIDTWMLLSGVLTVKNYFHDAELERLADLLYDRVDWQWMTNQGPTLTMGWMPETGFLTARWNGFSEHLAMNLMAIGSRTHPLSPDAWQAWNRSEALTPYQNSVYLQYPPLFVHQFSQAWIDFRGKRDGSADYWMNSRVATLAHIDFCDSLKGRFPAYGKMWGITASDGPKGYVDWGGPPVGKNRVPDPRIDGTVVPCAAAGSIPFAPKECISNLRTIKSAAGDKIYKKYGFVDAFNPQTGWVGSDVIGIDLGITLVMAENYRTGFVWRTFMANPEVPAALKAAGFM